MTISGLIRPALVLLIVSSIASAQQPAGEEASSEAMKLAKQRAEEYLQAFNSGEAAEIAELYAENADRVVVGEARISGREEIENFYRGFLADNRDAKLQISIENARLLRPNVLLAEGPWKLMNLRGGDERSGGSVVVFTRQDRKWQLKYLLVYEQ